MSNLYVKKEFGDHYIIEFVCCDRAKISTKKSVEDIMVYAAKESGATIIDRRFRQFSPEGVSGVILISESHFSIHTWPEEHYAAVDIFTCGKKMQPKVAISILQKGFGAKKVTKQIIQRGF